jgi:competence protein ComEC
MLLTALAFLGGIIILQLCSVLPDTAWVLLYFFIFIIASQLRRLRLVQVLLVGFGWAWLQAASYNAHVIPAEMEGKDLRVIGEIVSVPEKLSNKTRFIFKITSLKSADDHWSLPARVRLSWYFPKLTLQPGQVWQLTLRVKRPNGFMNPQGFDYEAWLFQQGIHAIGYVRQQSDNQVVANHFSLQAIRYHLMADLQEQLVESDYKGLFQALALGIRTHISQAHWHILQVTGTGHLIAISGLHIGLIAGLVFSLIFYLWRWMPSLCLAFPAPKAAAIASCVGALAYAFLAGLAIPTQRALVMITVVMLSLLADRFSKPSNVIGLALLSVLIMDSRSILSAGFWLSFGAVVILVYGLSCRYRPLKGLRALGKAQYLVTLGLLPLTILLFQQASLAAPLANLVAIPWVSFVTVPLVLSGTAILYLYQPFGKWLLWLADITFTPLFNFLEYLANFEFVSWIQSAPGIGTLVIAMLGVILLLSPRGIPVKRLGILFFLPVFLSRPAALPSGAVRLTVLDVGQGLAAVVETREHTLVYDTGPKFSDKFDTGSSVVLPFLIQQHRMAVDTLVVSHGDNDHRGGVESLLKQIRLKKLYTGEPQRLAGLSSQQCQAGHSWSWDNVRFSFLHPETEQQTFRDNDLSCVLKIETGNGSILFTGDIHKRSERYLVKIQKQNLAADILIAPHHGSRSSSHREFINQVNPKYVIFTAGYRNRFRHPNKKVWQRYSETSARLFTSAIHGAIQFNITPQTGIIGPITYRQSSARHWHRRGDSSP